MIVLAWQILSQLGLDKKIDLQLNSIGTNVCRSAYLKALKKFFKTIFDELSEVSKTRFNTNPLKNLDTKMKKNFLFLKLDHELMIIILKKTRSILMKLEPILML